MFYRPTSTGDPDGSSKVLGLLRLAALWAHSNLSVRLDSELKVTAEGLVTEDDLRL